jgi:hypothetical protein
MAAYMHSEMELDDRCYCEKMLCVRLLLSCVRLGCAEKGVLLSAIKVFMLRLHGDFVRRTSFRKLTQSMSQAILQGCVLYPCIVTSYEASNFLPWCCEVRWLMRLLSIHVSRAVTTAMMRAGQHVT